MTRTELVDRVRLRLAADPVDGLHPVRIAVAVGAELAPAAGPDRIRAAALVHAELTGLGPLQPLVADPEVSDVLVHAPDQVWVDGGSGLRRTEVRFRDDDQVRALARRLAVQAGRRLDDAAPFVDARLAGGIRLHAVLPPLAPGGTCLSLRIPPRRSFEVAELVARRMLPTAAAHLVRDLVGARVAFLVTGGTGTGKTTFLSSLLSLVPPAERIVLVEDCAELRPDHPHVVRLESRPANVEGAGGVELATLVRQALRMRPDRLVVGEVRGAEVVDLLAALNTGHDGGCGTVHANRSADLPARLEALGVAAGLSPAAVHSQLAAAVQVVLHLARGADRVRRLAEVAVVCEGPDGRLQARVGYAVHPDGLVPGPAVDRLRRLLDRGPG